MAEIDVDHGKVFPVGELCAEAVYRIVVAVYLNDLAAVTGRADNFQRLQVLRDKQQSL